MARWTAFVDAYASSYTVDHVDGRPVVRKDRKRGSDDDESIQPPPSKKTRQGFHKDNTSETRSAPAKRIKI